MAIIRNGKIYRNLQEQVLENTEDIEELWKAYGYNGPYASLDDITDPIDKALYLIGTEVPYEVYQYSELVQNYKDLGPFAAVGEKGDPGIQGPIGETGPAGADGQDGTDGITPHIGDNGDWYLGDTDTGVQAQGPRGIPGETGPAGANGRDGLTTSIYVNGTTYTQDNGTITLPDYASAQNMVTTNTPQTISARKTFNSGIDVFQANDMVITTQTDNNQNSVVMIDSDVLLLGRSLAQQIQIGNPTGANEINGSTKFSERPKVYKDEPFAPEPSYENVAVVSDLDGLATEGMLEDYELKSEAFSGNYNDLTNKPVLAPVATTGNYNDLYDKPTLFSGDYNDLTNKPTLFSGNYNDLTNKPDLSVYELKSEAFSGDYTDLTNKPDLSVYELKSEAFSGNYNDLTNKPTLFSGNYNDLTNKPDLSVYAESADLATVATSGSYNDLSNKPVLPDMTNYYTKTEVDDIVDNVAEDIPEVIANPATTTQTLNSLEINGVGYSIQAGGSGDINIDTTNLKATISDGTNDVELPIKQKTQTFVGTYKWEVLLNIDAPTGTSFVDANGNPKTLTVKTIAYGGAEPTLGTASQGGGNAAYFYPTEPTYITDGTNTALIDAFSTYSTTSFTLWYGISGVSVNGATATEYTKSTLTPIITQIGGVELTTTRRVLRNSFRFVNNGSSVANSRLELVFINKNNNDTYIPTDQDLNEVFIGIITKDGLTTTEATISSITGSSSSTTITLSDGSEWIFSISATVNSAAAAERTIPIPNEYELKTEEWTFTLSDNTTVTKKVVIL